MGETFIIMHNSWLCRLALGITLGFAFSMTCPQARADLPEAYPGSIWNRTSYDFNNLEGFGNEGNVTQGVQWFSLPGGIPVTTYASYRWRLRNRNQTYYDAHGPALGIEFSKFFFRAGMEYEWIKYPKLYERTRNFSVYLTWYKSFDFISGDQPSIFGIPVLGFPTSTWGRATNDFNNLEGVGAMGFVSQGIDWFTLPGDIVFRTQALYSWRFRSKNNRFYNYHGPAAGIELSRGSVNLGIEYAWLHYTVLQERTRDFRAYLTFYFDWDLKRKSSTQETAVSALPSGRISAFY